MTNEVLNQKAEVFWRLTQNQIQGMWGTFVLTDKGQLLVGWAKCSAMLWKVTRDQHRKPVRAAEPGPLYI